jgi:2-oxoglutarate dehydrogenase E2 component (dihydrolipoamide succinyltransferase)
MADILTPALGESVSEATIGKWTKKAGDAVKKDEVLVELETDKVSLEVVSPSDGVLTEIRAADGATVTPGAVLGVISEGASAAPAAEAPKADAPKAAAAPGYRARRRPRRRLGRQCSDHDPDHGRERRRGHDGDLAQEVRRHRRQG